MPSEHAASRAIPHVVRFDPYEADLDSGQLRKGGVNIKLREQSFQVLAALLERPGQVVTREDLRRKLWQDDVFVDFENNLNAVIARLREALGDSAEHPRFIETLPKRGYRFIGQVSLLSSVAAEGPVTRARLVVLPFVNLSGDTAEEYFSDAMTDEIITALASLAPEHLAVIARTTAMHYKGSHLDVARIGRELDIDYVVEGGVRRAGDHIAINVQLIHARDQTHNFAKKYNGEMRDVFTLQDCIAQAVAAHIPSVAVRLGSCPTERVKKKQTEDLVAYNHYINGRYHLYRFTAEGLSQAKQFFEQALARDPQFALAYDGLAEVYWWIGFWGLLPPKEAFPAGVFAALRAIEIDNTLAQTHALLASFRKELDYNWPEVERETKLALELNPTSPIVRFRTGSWLMPQGRLTELVAELEMALEYDPLDLNARCWLGVVHWLARRYDDAIKQAHLVLEIDPNYPFVHLLLGQTRCMEHKFDEALIALRKAVELYGGAPLVLGWLGLALGQSGNAAEARALLDRLHAIAAQAYVPASDFAWTHLALGEIDTAFTWMDRAIDERDPMMVPIKTYPFLDPLRADPRFTALLRKMNLEA